MRILAMVAACLLLAGTAGCSRNGQEPIDPRVKLDPEKTYSVVYWDMEPPWVLDPQGLYKPGVEALVEDFCLDNPGITVEVVWLDWADGEDLLTAALRDGVPPDIWADWQGLARMDHVLQVPAGIWLDSELLTAAGKRAASHQGQTWAWPRWLWPGGLLTVRSSLDMTDQELEKLVQSSWDWEEFGKWLDIVDMHVDVNDWQMEFSSQALLAATGYGYGNWGGQEMDEIFTALEVLKSRGRVGVGEYSKITGGNNIIGGAAPALVTWLTENLPGEETVLLPLPGVGGVNYYPVTAANLVQFKQLKYRGDDHTRAAAMLGEYLAVNQGGALAEIFWAAPAFRQSQGSSQLPQWYRVALEDCLETGVPNHAVDWRGRKTEMSFRVQAGQVLTDFWSGKANGQEIALRLGELE